MIRSFIARYIFIFLLAIGASQQTYTQQVFDIRKYGAIGDGSTDNAIAIQAAIDACSAAGGGRVWIPAGQTYLCGPIHLRSHIELFVDANAVLLASPDPGRYQESAFGSNPGEGTVWIGGRELEQVSIDGSGAIDGNGIAFMGPELEDSYALKSFHIKDPRPHTITLIGCRNVRIRDLTIRNSAYWTVHLAGCNDVVVSGITLRNSLKVRNSDGIDLDHSKNVRISDCYIESGDDGICFKNRREYQQYGACENILVTNCTITSRSCAIKIGSENMDTIRHILVTNCNIVKSNRGIGIQNRDEGIVSDISFSHLQIETHLFSDVWWGKAEPIYVTAYKRAAISGKDANWRFPPNATEGRVGKVQDIYFDDIVCHSENGIYVGCNEADKMDGIYFSRINLWISKTSDIPGGVYDRRPSDVPGIKKAITSGFFIDTAKSVSIQNCHVNWGSNRPTYFGQALTSYGVQKLNVSGLEGESAFPSRLPAISRH